ncbi:MAG: hypothetical protein BM557_06450 [Flavobacterium sp. MedPE-SWcel]|uniref:hypothetical protein n=1 Tax=uncultured Flavobacterium sp. TaxID=165435 RepID=UPI0009141599|nr:hypothetical protein [uncultured Flavobacterium sp.]OIQ19340.1 MAG: hypothetical protein BM557_06450 [Flavobacterium sp. MedPE-SWcel]
MKYIIILLFSFFTCLGQSDNDSFYDRAHALNVEILTKGIQYKNVEQSYDDGYSTINSEYIGALKDKNNNEFYILNTIYTSKSFGRSIDLVYVMIYNAERRLMGRYYLSNLNQLPDEIHDNKMIFKNICKEKDITISFQDGIPDKISLGCKGISKFYGFILNEEY